MRARGYFLFTVILTALPCLTRGELASITPFIYRDGLIWVTVSDGGNKPALNFLLDSGAGTTVLSRKTADRLHLKLGEVVAVRGVDGPCTARRVKGFTAQFAGISLSSEPLAINLGSVGRSGEWPIDGLIGADFFRDRVVQIDFAARRIRISKRVEIAGKCETLPLESRNDGMCVRAKIGGRDGQWLRIDTGFDEALEWVASVSQKQAQAHGTSIGHSSGSPRFSTNSVQLGALRFAAVRTGMHQQEIFPGEAGLLGNGLLARFRVTLDFGRRRLCLESLQ